MPVINVETIDRLFAMRLYPQALQINKVSSEWIQLGRLKAAHGYSNGHNWLVQRSTYSTCNLVKIESRTELTYKRVSIL
jgi:uncharacterized protein YqiB (DUF1249 family)